MVAVQIVEPAQRRQRSAEADGDLGESIPLPYHVPLSRSGTPDLQALLHLEAIPPQIVPVLQIADGHAVPHGDVVGRSTAGGTEYHAFRYTDNEGMKDLGTFGGKDSGATGINNLGDAVGWAETDDGVRHLFLYTDDLGMARIEVVGGWPAPLYHGIEAKINSLGEITGTVGDALGGQALEAFLLTPLP